MIFITEMELRANYRQNPFTYFELAEGCRLTAEARQFLVDRCIEIQDTIAKSEPQKERVEATANDEENPTLSAGIEKITLRLRTQRARVMVVGQCLLAEAPFLAEEVLSIASYLQEVEGALREQQTLPLAPFKRCSAVCGDALQCDNGDCFPISNFHVQLPKGKQITLLHALRCEVREQLFNRVDYLEEGAVKDYKCALHRVINFLNFLVCHSVGAKECQRQNGRLKSD